MVATLAIRHIFDHLDFLSKHGFRVLSRPNVFFKFESFPLEKVLVLKLLSLLVYLEDVGIFNLLPVLVNSIVPIAFVSENYGGDLVDETGSSLENLSENLVSNHLTLAHGSLLPLLGQEVFFEVHKHFEHILAESTSWV